MEALKSVGIGHIRIRPRRVSGCYAVFVGGCAILWFGCALLISVDAYSYLMFEDLTATVFNLMSWLVIIFGGIVTALGFWWAVASAGDVRKVHFEKPEGLTFNPEEVYKGLGISLLSIPLNVLMPGLGSVFLGYAGKRLAPRIPGYRDDPFDYISTGQKQILMGLLGWILFFFGELLRFYFNEVIVYEYYTYVAIEGIAFCIIGFTFIWTLRTTSDSFFEWGAPKEHPLYRVEHALGLIILGAQTLLFAFGLGLVLLACAEWLATGMRGMGIASYEQVVATGIVFGVVALVSAIGLSIMSFVGSIRRRYFRSGRKQVIKPAG